jgi:HEPN domain-containing protein
MTTDLNDYLKNWLFRANEDILVIENLFESEPEMFSSSICFHAQQAVEKFLKAFLVYHDIDFPKTHDLDFLLLECKKINDKIFDIDLGSLTDFGVSIRYPDDFYIPDKEQTSFFRDISLNVKKIVEANIKL